MVSKVFEVFEGDLFVLIFFYECTWTLSLENVLGIQINANKYFFLHNQM